MSKGGFRPGAGRKKGGKNKKRTLDTIFAAKAEEFAVFYRGMLERARSGVRPTAKERETMAKLAAELANEYDVGKKSKAANGGNNAEKQLPLEYMLKIMNDPTEDKEMRARMATAAAPYCHPRKGDGLGKKEDKADKAKQAASGKFAAGKAPIKLVK